MGGSFENWRLIGTVVWGIGVGVMFVVIQTIATLIVVLRDQSDVGEDKVLALLAASADDGFALSIATLASTFICVPVLIGIAMRWRHPAFIPALVYAVTLFAFNGLLFALHDIRSA